MAVRLPDRLSVTISSADRLLDDRARSLRGRIWREVAALTGLAARSAALADRQGKARNLRRDARRRTPSGPDARTRWRNVVLAGDWTADGPAGHHRRRGAFGL